MRQIERFYARHLPLSREMAINLQELWRQRCKLVLGLVSLAQFDRSVWKLLLEL